jgi:hypothetical protein
MLNEERDERENLRLHRQSLAAPPKLRPCHVEFKIAECVYHRQRIKQSRCNFLNNSTKNSHDLHVLHQANGDNELTGGAWAPRIGNQLSAIKGEVPCHS